MQTSLPRWNPPWLGEGAYLTKRFCPVRQQGELLGGTQLRSTRTSKSSLCQCQGLDSNRRIEIRVSSLSLVSFRHLSVLSSGRLISSVNIYHLFKCQIYHIVSLQFVGELEFPLWRWNTTFSDTEMKELGRSTRTVKTWVNTE